MNNSIIKINQTEKILLFFAGASMPLLNFRIDIPVYSMTGYMLAIILLVFYFLLNDSKYRKNFLTINIGLQDIFIILFIMSLAFSLLYSVNQSYGIERFLKLIFVVSFYFLIKQLLIARPYVIPKIMSYAIKILPLYIIYLSYYYLIKFNSSYLGINTEYATRSGKNALAFMVSIIIAFTINDLLNNKYKGKLRLVSILLNIISIIAVFIIQSRGLVIVFTLYLFLNFLLSTRKFNLVGKLTLLSFLFMLIINAFVPDNIISNSTDRLFSIVNIFSEEQSLEEGSIGARQLMIERSLDLFASSPIIGVGLGSFMYYGEGSSLISHNDYLMVLAEQGVIGLTLFMLLIFHFIKLAFSNYKLEKTTTNKSVFFALCGISVYFLMINAYDNILFWSLLAFVSATKVSIGNKGNLN